MRNIIVTCDYCSFHKTFIEREFEPAILEGWAYIKIRGPYKDMEICPGCLKRFLGVSELEEVKDND